MYHACAKICARYAGFYIHTFQDGGPGLTDKFLLKESPAYFDRGDNPKLRVEVFGEQGHQVTEILTMMFLSRYIKVKRNTTKGSLRWRIG